jgi:hypothetical protein
MSDMDKEIARLDRLAQKKTRERKKLREREKRAYAKVTDKKVRAAGKASGMQTRAELKREGYTLTKHGYERKSMLPRVKRDWPGGRDDRTGKRRYSWLKKKK